ncbi:MAG: extracellular solute-binding protein [Spirochaeta sp.]|jgi:multiple sugar transport system substrate-binding protein|nr:extracellular solute-binding protein [Spirochaeta sp.]
MAYGKRVIVSVMILLIGLTPLSIFAGGGQEETASPLEGERVDLEGESIDMAILGIGGWLPSSLAVEMSPLFAEYAKERFGYDAEFTFQESPFSSLFQKAATSLASRSQEFNIIISDSQWLGAFAEPGWIVPLNDVIANSEVLSELEWYDPIVEEAYMTYPDGSEKRWGLPQEADTQVLFIRLDLFEDPAEQDAFEAEYGYELPVTFEDWEDIDFEQYTDVADFFTRPEDDLYGTAYQYSKEYDFFTMAYYPYIWSGGGEIWDAESGDVWGILNTPENADALEELVDMQQYMPDGVNNYGISQIVDGFTSGRLATAIQWAAMGGAMIPESMEGQVAIVPPPGRRLDNGDIRRIWSLGGQPWVINAFNDAAHMQVALDFIDWWYLEETQLEFARRGGNPALASVLNSPGFEDIQPWFRGFKYMLTGERSRDFWHEPTYAEMLAVQQAAFTGYATGEIDSAQEALDRAAREQQRILNEAGRTDTPPPAN